MRKKFIILFIFIFLLTLYFKAIKPYKLEYDIKVELRDKWSVDIGKSDKLKIMKKSKPQWHGEHHKFILFELDDSDNILNHIQDNNLYLGKMDFDSRKRIIEIEEDLEIERNDRIDFYTDYYYTIRTKYKVGSATEQKNDILYIILIGDNHNVKMFLVEDLNVLDLERSF